MLAAFFVCARAAHAADGPFPVVPLPESRPASHGWAYLSLAAGAALIGGSFVLSDRANDAYDEYLGATDPAVISDRYDTARRYDRMAAASLYTGEGLVAFGIYLRFLRQPPDGRLELACDPHRVALTLRF